ncbi:MAG: hypothetical protein RI901_1075 [Actinomycetota bacterium]
MVDVSDKASTHRVAIATGCIQMNPNTYELIESGGHKKGDVLGNVSIEFRSDQSSHTIYCQARAETTGPTGVEMEALTATQIALLTIYDMCKAVDRGMVMSDIKLLEKSGGKSGDWKTS